MAFDSRLDYDREVLLNRLADMQQRIDALQEELSRANRLATLGILAGMIAHEFNNLLTPMISYAQMALQNPEDSDLTRKALVRGIQGAERLARISSAVLGLTRDSGDRTVADVAPTVREAITCLAHQPEKSRVGLVIEIPDGLCVSMSPVCLQQVVLNLALNALNAMRPNGGELRIAARTTGPGRVTLEVADTGQGIPTDQLERIFEPLVTIAGQSRESGHGLGLAICRRLVEEAGGRIFARSRPGHGSTFVIELPLATADEASRQAG